MMHTRVIGRWVLLVVLACAVAAPASARGGAGEDAAKVDRVIQSVEHKIQVVIDAGGREEAASLLTRLGRYCVTAGRFTHAAASFRRAAGLYDDLDKEVPHAQALMSQAQALAQADRTDDALPIYERAEAIFKKQGHTLGVAMVLLNRGLTLDFAGRDFEAIEAMRAVLALIPQLEKSHGKDMARTGALKAHQNLGVLYAQSGQVTHAREHYEQVLRWRTPQNDPGGYALTLAAIGTLDLEIGAYAEAHRRLTEALQIQRKLGETFRAAQTVRDLGVLHWRTNDLTRAEAYLEEAEDAFTSIDRPSEVVATGINLVNLARTRGDPDSSIVDRLNRLVGIARTLPDKRNLIVILTNLASAQARAGDWTAAREAATSALRLSKETPDALSDISNAMTLADVARGQGAFDKAIEHGKRALKIATTLDVPRLQADAHRRLASIFLATSAWKEALAHVRAGIAIVQRLTEDLSARTTIGVRETWSGLFADGTHAALKLQNADAYFEVAEAGRAHVLLRALGRPKARSTPEDTKALEASRAQVLRARQVLRSAFERGDTAAVTVAQRRLLQARTEHETLQRAASATAAAGPTTPVSLPVAQALLAPEEALVLFSVDGKRASALVVSARQTQLVDLGGGAELAALHTAFEDAATESDWAQAAGALRARVVAPLALPGTITSCFVSPDGPLAYVPLQEAFGTTSVVIAPSAGVLKALRARPLVGGRDVLAIADPLYDKVSSWRRLKASAPEAQAVGTEVHTRADASEAVLRKALKERPAWRAVHIAAHGDIDPHDPSRSALVLAADEHNDGRLQSHEIAALAFRADLVVLSACQSGVGRLRRSEGSMALARSFLAAGARAALGSLWPVDDDATRALMVSLYAHWNPKEGSGLPLEAALRRAQADVRQDSRWKHPRFWAAWQIWGAPGAHR